MEIKVYPNKQVSLSLKEPIIRLVAVLVDKLGLNINYINVIFVTDSQLKELHKSYLNADRETDVMTFNLNETGTIEGEIYISAHRAEEQAREYDVPVIQEICRLVIHGCLHLAGFNDQEKSERLKMKRKENALTSSLYTMVDRLIK
jgi:probable rRNA maturation factor